VQSRPNGWTRGPASCGSIWSCCGLTRLGVRAWFTPRDARRPGGFNLSCTQGTDLEQARVSREVLRHRLRPHVSFYQAARQVHSARARVVKSPQGCEETPGWFVWEEGDALATDTPGLALVVMVADCVPVYICDPVHQAVGLAHAGWRGLTAGVLQELLRVMGREWGTDISSCLVAIGPSIKSCCYEVDKPVLSVVRSTMGREWRGSMYPGRPLHLRYEPGQAALAILEGLGLPAAQCFHLDHCTSCHPGFHSHRRDGRLAGRGAGILVLTPGGGCR